MATRGRNNELKKSQFIELPFVSILQDVFSAKYQITSFEAFILPSVVQPVAHPRVGGGGAAGRKPQFEI